MEIDDHNQTTQVATVGSVHNIKRTPVPSLFRTLYIFPKTRNQEGTKERTRQNGTNIFVDLQPTNASTTLGRPLGLLVNELELRSFLHDQLHTPQKLGSQLISPLAVVSAALVLVSLENSYRYKEQ